MIEDLTLDPEPVSVPEHDSCENEDRGLQGVCELPSPPDPPPAAPRPQPAASRPNEPVPDPPGTCGVSEPRWEWLKKGERMVKTRIFRTVVAPSTIEGAGLGLFAGEFIPKGSHLGEYGGQKLQRGRKEACELRKRKHDTHVKRLGSIMHGDFMDARVTKTMTVGYYCDNGLVGSFINTRGDAGGQQQQEVNVKEVEYEQYFCHPYSLT